ncbi:MAG: DegV family protein [Oscillospiraceae bacterium]|nr:DegV family protein [Oscillospiraceae bacterium]
MNQYTIFADSACDIAPAVLADWGVPFRSLSFMFDGEETQYSNNELSAAEFYRQMRGGKTAKTSAVNPDAFYHGFEQELQQGRDVLYIGFSSGLSTTYNAGCIAAEELLEKYPDRKILTVDSLAASAGHGLLVYLTLQQKNNGATIEEAAQFAKDTSAHLQQWFTVDTLTYLRKGGRISATTATLGNMLDLRPILRVDEEGRLASMSKVRGRKASIRALVDKVKQYAAEDTTIFISHADCETDAKALAEQIRQATGHDTTIITDVGPVIGAHAGPGTLALFFVGK